jgi:hypothetical protein
MGYEFEFGSGAGLWIGWVSNRYPGYMVDTMGLCGVQYIGFGNESVRVLCVDRGKQSWSTPISQDSIKVRSRADVRLSKLGQSKREWRDQVSSASGLALHAGQGLA